MFDAFCVQNRAFLFFFFFFSLNPESTTHNIDERRQEDDDDGEDAHQGAVQPGLHDPFGNGLQRDWENLGRWANPAGKRTGKYQSLTEWF